MLPESETLEIAVAGDLRGHLIGTVSINEGQTPVEGVAVVVTGTTLAGGWSHTATTDGHGMFQLGLPCGSIHTIDLHAAHQSLTGRCRVHCGDLAMRLTPRPPLRYASSISLDGEWEFACDPPRGPVIDAEDMSWRTISVPSHWEMAGFVCETGTAAYRKRVELPPEWHGKRVRLRSEGIYSTAEVWLNGTRVGGHVGGATPFELDLSAVARPGATNTLVIVVGDRSPASDLDHMSFYAYWNLAGIWRPLELFCVEPAHIARLAVTTDLVNDYRDGWLSVEVDLTNEGPTPLTNAQLILRVHDQTGQEVTPPGLSATVSLGPWSSHTLVLSAPCEAVEPWSAETPNLYILIAEFVTAGQDLARVEQRFGFTRVEITGQTYRFNGRAVKLWGTCHHDIHPLRGRAITRDIARQDLELMKEANHNSLRTSHYPGHPAIAELADEIGLYVEDEAPFCWVGNEGFGPRLARPHDVNDLRLAPLWLSLTSALIERDRNHPCICLWSLGNESSYGHNFELAYAFVRQADPSRPVSCGDHRGDVDVATYHNPLSMERIAASAALPTPMLFDEAMANFQGANQSEALELDPGLRDYWVTGHLATLEAIRRSPQQAGVMIWAWADDLTLLPGRGVRYWRATQQKMTIADRTYKMAGRGIVGDAVWGTVDGWRRPRPEWWLTKKLYSPVHIDEHALPSPEEEEPIRIVVENRHDFVNLNRYSCTWILQQKSGVVRADVPPHRRGVLTIAPRHRPDMDDVLVLEFRDESGRLVDGYRLPFRSPTIPVPPHSGKAARMVDDGMRYLSLANVLRMVGTSVELAFDSDTGECLGGLAGGELVLVSGPALHVMKNDASPSTR